MKSLRSANIKRELEILRKLKERPYNKGKINSVFIVFQSQAEREKCLKAYNGWSIFQKPADGLTVTKELFEVRAAPKPENVIW